ncbi:MAG: hypothetical protein A2589_00535 [Candidatus Vogelbacteria bacterium RIFOXYD1_FULL_46_19]|uniref:Uncharacterized protein n=1 Tax=Candidatus Vogelbacteria bacterium RIFOXYD1_FULL_46_19 TaxID=1802439 RepID=A0A1G2QJI6_9BACT|nr:MAG: hypothetical protein A2589_00535 [Candidatus Vogelbacteria bacterium RIFOXYD1_FULL_46_19]
MKPKFEKGFPLSNKSETLPESDIARYWKRMGFSFSSPKPGSPAEARLREACESYSRFIVNPSLRGATGSEGRRRQLHNEISIMTVGEPRSGMESEKAEKIADFACLVATGLTAAELLKDEMSRN